jgi:hypothetical protein
VVRRRQAKRAGPASPFSLAFTGGPVRYSTYIVGLPHSCDSLLHLLCNEPPGQAGVDGEQVSHVVTWVFRNDLPTIPTALISPAVHISKLCNDLRELTARCRNLHSRCQQCRLDEPAEQAMDFFRWVGLQRHERTFVDSAGQHRQACASALC